MAHRHARLRAGPLPALDHGGRDAAKAAVEGAKKASPLQKEVDALKTELTNRTAERDPAAQKEVAKACTRSATGQLNLTKSKKVEFGAHQGVPRVGVRGAQHPR